MAINARAGALFSTLRPFVRARTGGEERCELCGAGIGADHAHVLELKGRKVACSCEACAILFSSSAAPNYRRIPRDVCFLPDFAITDAQWDALSIPIGMAFFCRREDSLVPVAYYPSPAGATESLLTIDAWNEIAEHNPTVRKLEPEVNCLLANRVARPHEYFVAPIDECYRLVGLIRSKWRGFAGGAEVWQEIGNFFTSLKSRSKHKESVSNART